MKCFAMMPGEYGVFAYIRYRATEHKGDGDPCKECELPKDLCTGPMGQRNFCHPHQREDKKQIVFKVVGKVKKRTRR